MDIPLSMQSDLGAWNGGDGISLEAWIGCMGSFELAVGYCTVFWPTFVLVDGYIVREGLTHDYINGWARKEDTTRADVERVINHIHLAYIHCNDEVSVDKLLVLGQVLKEIYSMKLKWQFPEHPCEVEFYIPDDKEDVAGYQLSFFQVGGDKLPAHQITANTI